MRDDRILKMRRSGEHFSNLIFYIDNILPPFGIHFFSFTSHSKGKKLGRASDFICVLINVIFSFTFLCFVKEIDFRSPPSISPLWRNVNAVMNAVKYSQPLVFVFTPRFFRNDRPDAIISSFYSLFSHFFYDNFTLVPSRWYRISDYIAEKLEGSGSNARCCYLTPIRKRSRFYRGKLMKTNLNFLNKCEEDAYQKLISGFNGRKKVCWEGRKKSSRLKKC